MGWHSLIIRRKLRARWQRLNIKIKREYLDFYAEAAAEKLRQYENREEWQFDGLVPVPVHPARKRKRGFNQAEILAKRMGERLEMPVCPEFLYRIRNTEPLKELNPDERLRNLQQAFQADAEAIRASGVQNVLLVDDIYTTGSTAEACTRALLSAGIEKVCFLPFVWTRNAKVGYDREDRQREAL